MTRIAISRRLRGTPYTARVEAAGVSAYTVYNHTLLPAAFESLEADYRHLKQHVQLWDVSCERQVEIAGPDAAKMVQKMTPRDLWKAQIDRCFYIPLVDETGGMLNDPVAVKLAEDRFWISIADSDVLLYAKGLAIGAGFDVQVTEPDVNILAIQGPKADDLAARVFGDEVRAIRFFRGVWLPFEGRRMFVARSGYSKQGGFEVYVDGWEYGEPLWDALMAAGADLNVRAGCPNLIERVEGGMLSYGNDITRENTPYEAGLGRYCGDAATLGCIGSEALIREASEGPRRMIRGLRIAGEAVPACRSSWTVTVGGARAGQATSATWSPDLGVNIAIAMMERDHWEPGTPVQVAAPDGPREAEVCALPFT